MTTSRSNYQQLAEHVFEQTAAQPLADFVADYFENNADASWRGLDREVYAKSKGLVQVTNVTLAAWYADEAAQGERNRKAAA